MPRVAAFLRVRVAGLMLLNEPSGNPLEPPAGGPAGGPAEAVGVGAEGLEGGVVVEEERAAAATVEVVEVVGGDDGELFVVVVVVVVLVEGFAAGGGGGASALVGWATLEETLLLELEVSVPGVDAAAEAPGGTGLVSDNWLRTE
jgi:hypothetical protein